MMLPSRPASAFISLRAGARGFLEASRRSLRQGISEELRQVSQPSRIGSPQKYGELRTTAPVAAPAGAVSPEPVAPVCEPKKREETPLEPVIWGAVIFIALLIFLFTAAPKKQLPTSEPQTAAAPAGAQPAAVSVPAGKPEKLYLEIIALKTSGSWCGPIQALRRKRC